MCTGGVERGWGNMISRASRVILHPQNIRIITMTHDQNGGFKKKTVSEGCNEKYISFHMGEGCQT